MAHRTIYLGPFEANCSSLQVVYSAYKTAMGRRQNATTGKASRAAKLKSAARRTALREESGQHDGFGADDPDEPQFAQPARKKARGEEPSRKSRRGEKRKPPLQGPPAAKPQRTPIGELQPEDAEQRRKKQRGYDKTAREKKKRAASPEAEQKLDEVPYSRTSTGKPRKGGTNAREAAKSRVKQKGVAWLESCGDAAQQAQPEALRDLSESKEKRGVAEGAGYHPSEEVEVAVFEKRQRQKQVKRAAATAKPRGRASDDKRSFLESNDVAGAPSPHQDPAEVPSL